MGRRRFIRRFGVLAFGLSTGLAWAIAFWLAMDQLGGIGGLAATVALAAIGFGFWGYLSGLIFWWLMEWLSQAANQSSNC
jgi:hypothetical protein